MFRDTKNMLESGGSVAITFIENGKRVVKDVALSDLEIVVNDVATSMGAMMVEHRNLLSRVKLLEDDNMALKKVVVAMQKGLQQCLDYVEAKKKEV